MILGLIHIAGILAQNFGVIAHDNNWPVNLFPALHRYKTCLASQNKISVHLVWIVAVWCTEFLNRWSC